MAAIAVERGQMLGHWRRWAPVAVLVGLCLVVGLINPSFFSPGNAVRMLNTAAIPLVVCMGATFIILMGSIDLSVEGTIALCAVAASMLGFAGIGIATAILGGVMVRIADPDFRNWLSLGRLFGIPAAVWIAGLAVLAAWIIQERTRIGRWIYAIGTDEQTARNSGIPVERTRILIFGIAGLFYGLAGALSAAQIGRGHALIAQDRLFTAITAVVVGGTALSGGVGSVLNSVIGVFIVIVLANGMVLMGIEPYVQKGVQGILIIAAVALALDRSRLDVVK